eukprot:6198078-Pleurochrysis_carterae.AAC.2
MASGRSLRKTQRIKPRKKIKEPITEIAAQQRCVGPSARNVSNANATGRSPACGRSRQALCDV